MISREAAKASYFGKLVQAIWLNLQERRCSTPKHVCSNATLLRAAADLGNFTARLTDKIRDGRHNPGQNSRD
jgi:hypothetical protein